MDTARVGQAAGGLLQSERFTHFGSVVCTDSVLRESRTVRFLTECKRRELLLCQRLPVLTLTPIARSMRDACRTNPALFAQEVIVRSGVVVEMKGFSGRCPASLIREPSESARDPRVAFCPSDPHRISGEANASTFLLLDALRVRSRRCLRASVGG